VKLRVVPVELKTANAHIEAFHRHHSKVQGHRFSIGVMDEAGALRAVACVGRPTSGVDPSKVLEVTRLCSDGTRNACSMLYSAAARAGKALGYLCIQTYIYESENGASLKASGWHFVRKAHPSGRHRARSDGEARDISQVGIAKTLWRCNLQGIPISDSDLAHHCRA
jgi:hypothetical protein